MHKAKVLRVELLNSQIIPTLLGRGKACEVRVTSYSINVKKIG